MAAHPLIVESAALGIALTAQDGALRVEPASRLPLDLRNRIVAAKPALLVELAANDDATDADRDLSRWPRFRDACLGRGVTLDELAQHFPDAEDREDIVQTPDADIVPCARTIVVAVLRARSAAIAAHVPPTVR